jgi:hypothetical protein
MIRLGVCACGSRQVAGMSEHFNSRKMVLYDFQEAVSYQFTMNSRVDRKCKIHEAQRRSIRALHFVARETQLLHLTSLSCLTPILSWALFWPSQVLLLF